MMTTGLVSLQDQRLCMRSFYSFARQLGTIRDGISTNEQKEMFDLEVIFILFIATGPKRKISSRHQEASWVPPIYVKVSPDEVIRNKEHLSGDAFSGQVLQALHVQAERPRRLQLRR